MKRILLIALVCLECIALVAGGWLVYRRVTRRQPAQYVTRLSRLDFIQTPIDGLLYYYGLRPNSVITDTPPWGGAAVTYRINGQGANDVKEYAREKPAGRLRVMVIGDSFAFGQYVPTSENFPTQLSGLFAGKCAFPVDVMNFGVPGYDIQYTVTHAMTDGIAYQPDLMVWIIKNDDFADIQERTWIMKGEIEEEASRSGMTDAYTKEYGPFFPEVLAERRMRESFDEGQVLAFQRDAFEKLLNAYHGTVVVATYTSLDASYRRLLDELAAAYPPVNILDSLRYDTADGMVFPDGHPTALAYRDIAAKLLAFIAAKQLLPCNYP